MMRYASMLLIISFQRALPLVWRKTAFKHRQRKSKFLLAQRIWVSDEKSPKNDAFITGVRCPSRDKRARTATRNGPSRHEKVHAAGKHSPYRENERSVSRRDTVRTLTGRLHI